MKTINYHIRLALAITSAAACVALLPAAEMPPLKVTENRHFIVCEDGPANDYWDHVDYIMHKAKQFPAPGTRSAKFN